MSKFRLFVISLLVSAGALLVVIYANRVKSSPSPILVSVTNNIFVTAQLKPEDIGTLRNRGIRIIVDIRPDGEASDQAPSSEIEDASKRYGMNFHYIPVPHESIPDSAVTALGDALSKPTTPTVLYCRSGRRAVRLFALAEASRTNGPEATAIMEMVREAGFSADDLRDNIAERISHRHSAPAAKN